MNRTQIITLHVIWKNGINSADTFNGTFRKQPKRRLHKNWILIN